MITAQVLSAVAFAISWVWWVSFVIGLIVLVVLQMIWCCRQSKAGIIAASCISVIASIVCLFIGIWLILYRKDVYACTVFTLEYDDDDDFYYSSGDYCPEKTWAGISFVGAVLWLLTGCFSAMFILTGRYDKWEAKYRPSNNDENTGGVKSVATAVEMGNVNAIAAAVDPEEPKTDEASHVIPSTTATAVPVTTDAYVPPQIAKNVGEA